MINEDDNNPSWPSFLAGVRYQGSKVKDWNGGFHGNRGAFGRLAFLHARPRVIPLGPVLDMHSLQWARSEESRSAVRGLELLGHGAGVVFPDSRRWK